MSPGNCPSPGGTTRGVAARDHGRLVGFVAAIPRRIADRADTPRSIPVVSLFAVDPAYRGAGIGRRLVAGLYDAVGPELLLYTEPQSRAGAVVRLGSGGPRVVLHAHGGASHLRRRSFRITVSPLVVAQECRIDEFLEAIRSFGPTSGSNSRPTRQQVGHYLDDPRGAMLTVARGPDDRPCAAALIIRSELMTTSGAQFTPSLDSIWARSDDEAALAAFATLAIDRWPDAAVVTAPNLSHMSPTAVRGAGFRATRSSFSFTVIAGSSDSWTGAHRWHQPRGLLRSIVHLPRHAEIWLPGLLAARRRREVPDPAQPIDIMFCIADHFEPAHGEPGLGVERARVAAWTQHLPALANHVRDADGTAAAAHVLLPRRSVPPGAHRRPWRPVRGWSR